MKKTLIGAVIIVILIIVFFILNSRSGMAPMVTDTPLPSASEKVFEILISGTGLSKNNLTLKAGDAVKFINHDSLLHWPASGTHPAHLGCPGFDVLRGLKQGESFSFVFQKVANCSFHDHLNARNASYNGNIIITE